MIKLPEHFLRFFSRPNDSKLLKAMGNCYHKTTRYDLPKVAAIPIPDAPQEGASESIKLADTPAI